jgi:hypothetical protein
MRSAIATLILSAGVATAALAQTPPATAPAAPVAPAAPPPAATAPAATAPAAAPPAAAPGAGVAPAPAAEAPPPEKTYTVPTEGEVGQIINIINTICVPLVHDGVDIKKLATTAAGWKYNRRDDNYVATLVQKPYTVTLFSPGSNKNVCRLAINYTTGEEKPIIVGLNIYALLHKPELEQQRNDFVPATDFKRITNSWEYFTDHESIGLVFLQLKKPDGTEINPKWSTGEVLYSERQF